VSNSQDIVARLRKLEGGGLRTFAEDPPMVWEKAEGCHVWDADGKRYLDLYGGFAVAATNPCGSRWYRYKLAYPAPVFCMRTSHRESLVNLKPAA